MPTITFKPSGTVIQCSSNQTIVEAAAEQGVDIYVGCKNGQCMICQSERISGSFHFRNSLGQQVLEHEDRVLCCVANPLTDSELYMPSVYTPDYIEPITHACQVSSMELLGDNMWHVELLLPAGKTAHFWPGQYLLLHFINADGVEEQVPYSIACGPSDLTNNDPRRIELHIASHTERAECIVCYLKDSVVVKVTLPQGECFLNKHRLPNFQDQPLLLVAAGSGFTQIKSIVEGLLTLNPEQDIHIYWSNKNASGFYIDELPQQWAAQYPNIQYHAIVEQPQPEWSGRAGMIYQVISEDFDDLSGVQVFACGSPNMVYGTLDQLAKLGLTEDNMNSDVFSYAPRA